jgi:hypothetical protein
MSKVAKNIKNNVVIGWVVVSVECKVRTEQPTTIKIANYRTLNG